MFQLKQLSANLLWPTSMRINTDDENHRAQYSTSFAKNGFRNWDLLFFIITTMLVVIFIVIIIAVFYDSQEFHPYHRLAINRRRRRWWWWWWWWWWWSKRIRDEVAFDFHSDLVKGPSDGTAKDIRVPKGMAHAVRHFYEFGEYVIVKEEGACGGGLVPVSCFDVGT